MPLALISIVMYLVHSMYALVGAVLNSVLLYCMFHYTPAKFRVFGILMKVHSICDLIGTVASFLTMQRIIPCGWSLLYISYGPCRLIGSFTCYITYMITLFIYVVTFYITMVSFIARLHIVQHGNISLMRATIHLVCWAIPIPGTFIISFIIGKSDDATMVAIMNTTYPHYYEEGLTITGSEDLSVPSMLIVMVIVCGLIGPLYGLILKFRHATLKVLNQANLSMSNKTKNMHKEFVQMLTLQALLPLVLILAVLTFSLGQFKIINHPALESASLLIGETPSLLSPLIVFYHVPAYRKALTDMVYRNVPVDPEESTATSQERGAAGCTAVTVRSNLITL